MKPPKSTAKGEVTVTLLRFESDTQHSDVVYDLSISLLFVCATTSGESQL